MTGRWIDGPRPQGVAVGTRGGKPVPAATVRGGAVRHIDWARILPPVILLYSILLPMEVRVEIAGQSLFLYRIVCIMCIPWALLMLSRHGMRRNPADFFMYVAAVWMIVSFFGFYGDLPNGIRGLPLALDFLMPYVIFRVGIRSLDDLRVVLIFFVPGAFAVGLVMALESLSHQYIMSPVAAEIFGSRAQYIDGQAVGQFTPEREIRLGLMRASGPFAHPILAGMVLGGLLPMYWYSGLRGWPYVLGIGVPFFALFSLSSGAILALLIVIGLVVYDFMERRTTFLTWPLLIFSVLGVLLVLQFVTENGVFRFLIRFTLDPRTGFYRTLVWEYGIKSMMNHPWFGIGFSDYERLAWMTPSIDAHWLLAGVRHGFIVPLAQLAAVVTVVVRLVEGLLRQGSGLNSDLVKGILFSLVALVIGGFTVAFFGGAQIWFFGILGAAAAVGAEMGRNAGIPGRARGSGRSGHIRSSAGPLRLK